MIAGLIARLRSLWRGLRWRSDVEAEMSEEFRVHVELRAADLVRSGLSPGEAARRARLEFGHTESHKQAGRASRGLNPFDELRVSWLDFKLGFRMLVKYPGLTIVGGLAMAFAIWVGAVTFQLVTLFVHPTLPLPDGDRIVQIRNWNVAANDPEWSALHDFLVWREALKSVTDLGAWRDVTRNLIGDDRNGRPVAVAEITASAFRIAPTPPMLGRTLVPTDERAGSPPVVVLGHDVWRTRFASDPDVVGRTVQLGEDYATVIGVMPEGFAFPVSHDVWTPLRPDLLHQAPREGYAITVFGRLAPGVTLEEAQADLTALGRRTAADFPATHEHLHPQVGPYATVEADLNSSARTFTYSIYLYPILLLLLVCSNVALLLFARAATRENELVVRSALGASRRRIIAQLFAEALVLGAVAAVVGLGAAHLGLHLWGRNFLEINLGRLPFWYDLRLSPATVLYTIVLTVLGAVIAGVLPALKTTRGLGSRLRQGSAGGGGLRFGGVWTAVIIAQVAVTVAFPAVVYVEQRELVRIRSFDVGFDAERYLTARLAMDEPTASGTIDSSARAAHLQRFGTALEMLRRRLAAQPGVAGVTFVDRLPRMGHVERAVGLDDAPDVARQPGPSGSAASPTVLREVSLAWIDPSYFDVLETPILAGRGFHTADLAPSARVVIADQGFVDEALQGRNPIGRRVRISPSRTLLSGPEAEALPWYEIVGVVKELGMRHVVIRHRQAGLYLPGVPGSGFPPHMLVNVAGDPLLLGPRLHELASAVDPTLRVSNVQRADEVSDEMLWIIGLWLRMTVVLTAVALLLSLAGIYSVMSFTVSRRTREIGVRVALGASPRRVVAAIFRRPLTQVGLGVVAGGGLIAAAAFVPSDSFLSGDGLSPRQVALLVAYAALMFGVCLLACVVPTRRALRVEPTEALRADG